MSDEPTLADDLRARACPAGLPHTGDDPASDHGHTDCWLFHRAADALDAYEWVEQRADRRIAELEARLAAAGDDPCPECEGTGVRHR